MEIAFHLKLMKDAWNAFEPFVSVILIAQSVTSLIEWSVSYRTAILLIIANRT